MKGIIVAAGYGTRFLPVTKTVPKEMLPILSRPSIDYIVEEFILSGIREIIIISSRRKRCMEDYFDRETELESLFKSENSPAKLAAITPPQARFVFVRQTEMKGTGHALLQVAGLIGNEPVVVAYPDDIHTGDVPLTAQLIHMYEQTGCSVMATIHDPPHLERYGVLKLAPDGIHVADMVEKPSPGSEPSREVSIGRYLYTPEFFHHLQEGWDKHTKGEYFHLYALKKLMDQKKVVYKQTEGLRLDTGDPAGYLRAIIQAASRDPELRGVLEEEMAGLKKM
jgi:UTP--glucose-1-phosphate uridylyltransferase